MKRASSSGFTLLETVVAMAILAMALMAIFNLNSGAVAMHAYTKRLTVATLLARSKMTDIEQELYDKGFSADDDEEDGDFSEEGWPQFKWRATILAPKTEGLPPEQLLGALFNIPMGMGGGEGGGDSPLGGLGALFGGAAAGGGKDAAAGGGMAAALGPMAGMAQGQFGQLVDQITKTVREVHLTVFWKDGTELESIDLVTHVVSTGQGSDRNGTSVGGSTPSTPPGNQIMVDSVTGAPVPNPQNGLNPATGNPVMPQAQWMALHGGGTTGGGINPGLPGRPGGMFPQNPGNLNRPPPGWPRPGTFPGGTRGNSQ